MAATVPATADAERSARPPTFPDEAEDPDDLARLTQMARTCLAAFAAA